MSTKLEEPNCLAIKDTVIRRYLTVFALKTIARFNKWHGPCVPISRHIMVKTGESVGLTEAATMSFIAAQTNIPVPRVHCSFTRNHSTYIVMERIRGKTLAHAWPGLSDLEVEDIFIQLREMLQELRAIPAPGTAIESCLGGSLRDSRIPRSRPRFGPFPSTLAFHHWLREGLEPGQFPDRENDDDWVDIKRMVAMQDGREWPLPVFTHGDLNPFNIIIRNAKVVGIIDWEFSGWYPYYWEYTSAWLGNKTRQGWQKLIPKFLDLCQDELQMEKIRQRWWGDF